MSAQEGDVAVEQPALLELGAQRDLVVDRALALLDAPERRVVGAVAQQLLLQAGARPLNQSEDWSATASSSGRIQR